MGLQCFQYPISIVNVELERFLLVQHMATSKVGHFLLRRNAHVYVNPDHLTNGRFVRRSAWENLVMYRLAHEKKITGLPHI